MISLTGVSLSKSGKSRLCGEEKWIGESFIIIIFVFVIIFLFNHSLSFFLTLISKPSFSLFPGETPLSLMDLVELEERLKLMESVWLSKGNFYLYQAIEERGISESVHLFKQVFIYANTYLYSLDFFDLRYCYFFLVLNHF